MKWIKTYTRLLESSKEPVIEFVEYTKFPTHLAKFSEVLVGKFKGSIFGVLDGNDVKLQALVPIKNLDEKESNEKWIILHNIKENYGGSNEDFFLRVYVLEENKGEFEKVLAFDAEKYPTIKKWEAVKADDQYQYKEVKINKKETQLEKDWENPKKVLIYKFSNKFIRDNKYWSGYKGSLMDQDRNPFPDHTIEVDFAEKFYIDNLIRSLKKNSKISKWIGDDGSVKEMPALYNKSFYYLDTETKTPNVFISLEKYVSECEGDDRDYFKNIGYIPLNELLKEMIGILGYDTKDWELKFVESYTNLRLLTPGSHSHYWYISSGEGICAKKEVCCFKKVMVKTKENPKENLRYIIFDKLSKGIPQNKAEEIYKKYKDNPTAVVEPKVIFELPK
jgi:hypothetical protein